MDFTPLNCKTHFSVRESINKPKTLLKAASELKYETFGIADYGHISGCVQFKNVSNKILIGSEIFLKDGNSICLYSKNFQGWLDLCKITSRCNTEANYNTFEDKPEISYNDLLELLTDNLIVIYMYPENNPCENCFYGIDINNLNYSVVRSTALGKKRKKVCMHTIKAPDAESIEDLYLLFSIRDNKNLETVMKDYPEYKSGIYYIPSIEQLLSLGYSEDEIENTGQIRKACEDYALNRNPMLPKFGAADSDSAKVLTDLCERALAEKGLVSKEYSDRLKEELSVITTYNLSDYFLIISDIYAYINKFHKISGIRGSGGGSLVSFLLEISQADPLKYGLLFERFMNAGRFSSERVQLPDIDIDVPAEARDRVIEYIKSKYTIQNVGQILTYQRIKTASAIKAIFKSKTMLSFEEVNRITKGLPEEAKISDELKKMKEPSVLLYALENNPEYFREWATLNEDGSLSGDYANLFEQVIHFEGINSARSKHAAGVIIGPEPLENICPMVFDTKNKTQNCGMEMNDLEAIGLLKVDILGLRLFDKMIEIIELIK